MSGFLFMSKVLGALRVRRRGREWNIKNILWILPAGNNPEFGKYAQQANGTVLVHYGDTVIMVNVTASEEPREGTDFFRSQLILKKSFIRWAKSPALYAEKEDPAKRHTYMPPYRQALRPLFPKGMRNDVQVIATALSVDQDVPPDIPAMIGSSAAIAVSDIPWNGPIGAVEVGLVDGQFVINPDELERQNSILHLTVAGTEDAIMMVEGGAEEISEDVLLDAILLGHESIKEICAFQKKIAEEIGKPKKEFPLALTGEDIKEAVREFALSKVQWAFDTFDRKERQAREKQIAQEVQEHFAESFEGREQEIADALYDLNKEVMRRKIVDQGIRPDGRTVKEVRPIWCETGILPRTHGSAVFTRGQTQALTVTTLGTLREAQMLDGLSNEDTKRYIHHYNFPPYCTGETGRLRSPGRREIGHGALAEGRASRNTYEEEFPYAIRLVSEILSSNGSSS